MKYNWWYEILTFAGIYKQFEQGERERNILKIGMLSPLGLRSALVDKRLRNDERKVRTFTSITNPPNLCFAWQLRERVFREIV